MNIVAMAPTLCTRNVGREPLFESRGTALELVIHLRVLAGGAASRARRRWRAGFPDSVPAWYTGPSGARRSMTSARPPTAASGRPPPTTLPKIERSGVMP